MKLEEKIRKLMKFGGVLLLAFNIYCNNNGSNSEDESDSTLINNVYYESNSFNNSLNHFFVTGEDITVYAELNEDADSVYISTKREVNNGIILYHESPGNVKESVQTRGLIEESNFASIGEPSNFVNTKIKTKDYYKLFYITINPSSYLTFRLSS